MPVTIKESLGYTEATQEASDEGETKIDKLVGEFIKRRKPYKISLQLVFTHHMKI